MKKLIIVRHAKSSWDFPELNDYDRPLNKRGKKNAPEMGKRLASRGILPDLIITSPAKRAAATAKRIAIEVGYGIKDIKKEPLFYHGSINDIIKVIRSINNKISTLMIFGHNPDWTSVANLLTGSDIYNIPTCGIAEIDFDVSAWTEVEKNKGTLVNFDYPKKVLTAG